MMRADKVFAISYVAAALCAGAAEETRLCAGTEPAISPDGRTLAFQENLPRGSRVGIRPVAGGPTTWVSADGYAAFPAWKPDGTLVFTYGREDVTAFADAARGRLIGFNLYAYANGAITRLTTGHVRDYTVAAAPDGTLYFASTRGETDCGYVDDRAQLYRLRPGDDEPQWVWGPGSLYSAAAVSPRVSPDGKRLVWAQVDGVCASWRIVAARVDAPASQVSLTPGDMVAYAPSWCPDGQRILFTGCRGGGDGWGVWALEPVSGDMRFLVKGHNPVLSPDGQTLYYDQDGFICRQRLNPDALPPVRPAASLSSVPPEKTLVALDRPACGTSHPLGPEAAFGEDAFYLRVRFRMDAPAKKDATKYRYLVKGDYATHRVAFQLFFQPGQRNPVFAVRNAEGLYAPLICATALAPGSEHEIVAYRKGSSASVFIDGASAATIDFGGVQPFRGPKRLVVGDDFGGEVLSVRLGTGYPSDLPHPLTVQEVFK